MKLQYLDKLEFGDDAFAYAGRSYAYDEIASIEFQAVQTKHSVNFIPAGTSYDAYLKVHLANGRTVRIGQEWSLWRGDSQRVRMEAVWRAKEILSEMSFANRVEPLEKSVAQRGFFAFGRYQFHKDGDVFKDGKLLFNLKDKTISARLGPFQLHLVRQKRGLEKLAGAFFNLDHVIDISRDRDCILYMFRHVYGLAWNNEPVRTKRMDPRKLYFTAIVKLGAQLAKADGNVSPDEIATLKRHFNIDGESFPEAGRIFNEALAGNEAPEAIARQIVEATRENREFREYIVIGLVMIATSDGSYHPAEHRVIAAVAAVLGFSAGDLDHILAMCGVRREARHDWRRGEEAAASTIAAQHLLVLGLGVGATIEQIKAAYRRLARQHHPDHLTGKGVPIDEIKAAESILKTINVSYAWLLANYATARSSRR